MYQQKVLNRSPTVCGLWLAPVASCKDRKDMADDKHFRITMALKARPVDAKWQKKHLNNVCQEVF